MRQRGIRQISVPTTTPAPVRGLNAYDSIVSMPKGFALVLRNFYAQPYGCSVRKGFRRHCTEGILGNVESLVSHNAMNKKLYAFADDSGDTTMYEVTVPNAVAVPVITGLSNARWQSTSLPNAAGVNSVMVNGADDMIWINNAGTATIVSAGDGTANTIKNVNPSSLIGVYPHQKRLWFVEKESTRGWYLPPDQIYGEAKSFDFGGYWSKGGSLNQIITWTIDDGDGADDHLIAISTEGQVSVFRGLDVDAADNWELTGVYYAGAPVGRRSAIRHGGDVLIVTELGIVFMSDLLKSTKVNPAEENITKYTQQILSNASSATGDLFGWQPFIFPASNMLLVNIPATESTSYQLAMNDITKAWSEFIGYNAYCWALHNQLPFFGSLGGVYRAWEGTTDDEILSDLGVVTPGSDIRAEAQTSFDYFESLGNQKHFKMVRPTILSRGAFQVSLAVNTDFVFDTPTAPGAFSPIEPGRWDEDLWDNAIWEGGLLTFKGWQSVTGIGTAAALRLLLRATSETYWASTDWLIERGGVM